MLGVKNLFSDQKSFVSTLSSALNYLHIIYLLSAFSFSGVSITSFINISLSLPYSGQVLPSSWYEVLHYGLTSICPSYWTPSSLLWPSGADSFLPGLLHNCSYYGWFFSWIIYPNIKVCFLFFNPQVSLSNLSLSLYDEAMTILVMVAQPFTSASKSELGPKLGCFSSSF